MRNRNGFGFAVLALLVAGSGWGQKMESVRLVGVEAKVVDGRTIIETRISLEGSNEVEGLLHLGWVDHRDEGQGKKDVTLRLQTGEQSIRTEVPLPEAEESLKWLRLEVEISPTGFRSFPSVKRVYGLTEIADFVFEIEATRPLASLDGTSIRFQASAVNPKTRRVQGGVTWAVLDRDDGMPVSRSAEKEIAPGIFEFELRLYNRAAKRLCLVGTKGEYRQELQLSHTEGSKARAVLQTDKPIYQPGQVLHARGVIWDEEGKADTARQVMFKVRDPKGEVVFDTEMASSAFGVVAFDWRIPESAASGRYVLVVEAEEGPTQVHSVRIAKYELPQFTVRIEPAKSAFLGQEEATVTVSAEYLSKKPLVGGKVRIESAQREKEAAAQGVAGADGTFRATFSLPPLRGKRLYEDHEFIAYCTDPVTQRTEQKRFSLRRSQEALHIYAHFSKADPGLIYAVVSNADGKSVQASVEAQLGEQRTVAETNRFGVARLRMDFAGGGRGEKKLELAAKSGEGLQGQRSFAVQGLQPQVALRAAKRVYGSRERVSLQVRVAGKSNFESEVLLRAVLADEKLAWQEAVKLRDGAGTIDTPALMIFSGIVRFEAWMPGAKTPASLAVVFPETPGLRVSAKAGKEVYRPGEAAKMGFQVKDTNGQAVRAALGVAIVDEAVSERAQEMQDFGRRRYWFDCLYCSEASRGEIDGIGLEAFLARQPGDRIDADLDLVAEVLLEMREPQVIHWQDGHYWELSWKRMEKGAERLKDLLKMRGATGMLTPRNDADLMDALGGSGFSARDPWERPFRFAFGVERGNREIRLLSAGPDGIPGTEDDLQPGVVSLPYFGATAELIEDSLRGLGVLPATVAAFVGRLEEFGIHFGKLRDPWGNAYRVSIATERADRVIRIESKGPDGLADTDDDFDVHSIRKPYFVTEGKQLDSILENAKTAPENKEAFVRLLAEQGVELDSLHDAWGRNYYLQSRSMSHYSTRYETVNTGTFGGRMQRLQEGRPTTQRLLRFSLWSKGPDDLEDTYDDFEVWSNFVYFAEATPPPAQAAGRAAEAAAGPVLRGSGTLFGFVTDASGAAVPRTSISLSSANGLLLQVTSGEDGAYVFRGLEAGLYQLSAEQAGFNRFALSRIPILTNRTLQVDFELEVGRISEMVSVMADTPMLQTSSSQKADEGEPTFTPRVREYFPETLLWLPELVTGVNGQANAKFSMADSVTNWKVAVFASSEDGRWATAESSVRSFQPFFIDLDPPAVLTEGDSVEIPAVVRNYTESAVPPKLVFAKNNWGRVEAEGENSVRLRAMRAESEAVLEATAKAGTFGDTVRKPIVIVPDGKLEGFAHGALFTGSIRFTAKLSNKALSWGRRGELRIYQDGGGIIEEAVRALEGIPAGCGEQIASRTFANLIVHRWMKAQGAEEATETLETMERIRDGLQKLEPYYREDGGVAYWNERPSDLALSAFVLQLLVAADGVVSVDRDRIAGLVKHLLTDKPRLVKLGGLGAMALGAMQKAGAKVSPKEMDEYFSLWKGESDPTVLAGLLEAALAWGKKAEADEAGQRLLAKVHRYNGTVYWEVERALPFYAWGTAGTVETSAHAMRALARWRKAGASGGPLEEALRGAALYLMLKRMHGGYWYSTQTTMRSVEAIAEYFGGQTIQANSGAVLVRVNGKAVGRLRLSTPRKGAAALRISIGEALQEGENQVELEHVGGVGLLLAQYEGASYSPWNEARLMASADLAFAVRWEKLEAGRGDFVKCEVSAGRTSQRGYGMLIAEVGLGPGIDVDRASLEAVLQSQRSRVDHYELRPGKVIFYLWPRGADSRFEFLVRPRLAMQAKTSVSRLYDYNNPEAVVEARPVEWVVRD